MHNRQASKEENNPSAAQPSSLKGLHYVKLKGEDTHAALLKKYAYRITDTIKHTIKGSITNDPVAKQYIPQTQELQILPEEHPDPIGDKTHSPVKGIVHRYPDRVLFKPANVCAVYCRYCFRREQVGPKDAQTANILNTDERTAALDYIRTHPEIWEVILTGGDPLILSPRQLGEIMDALRAINHVKVIRIHTRVPIADPGRLTPALFTALTGEDSKKTDRSVCSGQRNRKNKPACSDKALYMALHINHAQELTPEVRQTITTLHQRGISLLSQSVLLKGVNNDAAILADLYRQLVTLRVKPYYLHHPDLAPGTGHFRLSIKEGQNIMRALRGRLSGLCQPTYMLDIPGGHGKIPLTPCALEPMPDGGYNITDYQDEQHIYAPQSESQNHE